MTKPRKIEHNSTDLSINLIEGGGKKGTSAHDFYWHIYSNDIRAGQVYIDFTEDTVLGKHASIHIFLNKKSQGKGIGRIGYRMACEQSGLSVIYAHMRKNNIASKKAAIAAGFEEVKDSRFNQLVMIWRKEE